MPVVGRSECARLLKSSISNTQLCAGGSLNQELCSVCYIYSNPMYSTYVSNGLPPICREMAEHHWFVSCLLALNAMSWSVFTHGVKEGALMHKTLEFSPIYSLTQVGLKILWKPVWTKWRRRSRLENQSVRNNKIPDRTLDLATFPHNSKPIHEIHHCVLNPWEIGPATLLW